MKILVCGFSFSNFPVTVKIECKCFFLVAERLLYVSLTLIKQPIA